MGQRYAETGPFLLLPIEREMLREFLMERESEKRGRCQTAGVDLAGHGRRFDGGDERVALTLPTGVHLLNMFNHFHLRRNDL